ncbi:MAG: hypothetical protein J5537_00705 [Lachnospiraceae bacterium]|nr:hypothetical protein [Lachnospiraceae bacterium]
MKLEIKDAVDKAIDAMPGGYVIKPYLVAHIAEVAMSCFTEYDEAKVHGWFREEGRQEGEAFGMIKLLLKQNASSETIISELMSVLNLPEDEAESKLEEYLGQKA